MSSRSGCFLIRQTFFFIVTVNYHGNEYLIDEHMRLDFNEYREGDDRIWLRRIRNYTIKLVWNINVASYPSINYTHKEQLLEVCYQSDMHANAGKIVARKLGRNRLPVHRKITKFSLTPISSYLHGNS